LASKLYHTKGETSPCQAISDGIV